MSEGDLGSDPLDEIRRALSVRPSPEFAAKVRERIAREPKRRWMPVIVWPLSAAAAVVLVFVLTLHTGRERASGAVAMRPEAPAPAVPPTVEPPQALPASRVPALPAAPRVAASRGSDMRAVRPARFEVLVPNDQRLAIDRLLRDLNDGRLDPATLAFASVDPQAELSPPPAIAVAPIEIPAIGGIDIKK